MSILYIIVFNDYLRDKKDILKVNKFYVRRLLRNCGMRNEKIY